MTPTRKLLRANGTEKALEPGMSMRAIRVLIGADCLDTVRLRHWGEPLHIMFLDDLGGVKDLPINREATSLYHANCVPGVQHPIRGDVVVIPDDDTDVPNERIFP